MGGSLRYAVSVCQKTPDYQQKHMCINRVDSTWRVSHISQNKTIMDYKAFLDSLNRDTTNHEIFQWLEGIPEEISASKQFTHDFIRIIAKCYIVNEQFVHGHTHQRTALDKNGMEGMERRVPVLMKYLDETFEKEVQALIGAQLLSCQLKHPQGVAASLFEFLYDHELVSTEAFIEWDRREGPAEDMFGKEEVKKDVAEFFRWIKDDY